MDLRALLGRFAGQPEYRRRRCSPGTYLMHKRRQLLDQLPDEHRFHDRATPAGLLYDYHPPNIGRIPFTDAELKDIKKRRSRASIDPDNPDTHLKKSQLVSMWKADHDQKEQLGDLDLAQPITEEKKYHSGLDRDLFHAEDIVGEKRKRVVPAGYEPPSRRQRLDDAMLLADREIEEEVLPSIEGTRTFQTREQLNEYLRAENEALRAAFTDGASSVHESRTSPTPPLSPTWSTTLTDASSDDDQEVFQEIVNGLPDGPPEVEDNLGDLNSDGNKDARDGTDDELSDTSPADGVTCAISSSNPNCATPQVKRVVRDFDQ